MPAFSGHNLNKERIMTESQRHISIQKGQQFPELTRCTTCCDKFHCPFCSPSVYKPCRVDRVRLHLKCHLNRAIIHGDFTVHRCGLKCRANYHYHCPFCTATILRKHDFDNHLQVCKNRPGGESKKKTDRERILMAGTILTVPNTSCPPIKMAALVACTPSTSGTAVSALPIVATPPTTESVTSTSACTTVLPFERTSKVEPVPKTITSIFTKSSPVDILPILNTPPTTITAVPTLTEMNSNLAKTRMKPVVKITCPMCHIIIHKTNLQKHIERKHSDVTALKIDDTFQLTAQCIDKTNGIYVVLKVVRGNTTPVHVKYKTCAGNQTVLCESNECQLNIGIAQRSGIPSYQCMHISAASCCKTLAEHISLKEDILSEMVRVKLFSEKKKQQCLGLQHLAESSCMPLSVQIPSEASMIKRFVSVYEPTLSSYSTLGRVMVVYNTFLNTWNCPCKKIRHACLHKYIAKWHLFQTHPKLLSSLHSGPMSEEDSAVDNSHVYPPVGLGLEFMVNYILQNKKIPAVLPEEMRLPLPSNNYPKTLCPPESECQECPGDLKLSDPILITQKAKILTNSCIIEDVSTYCKQCPQCGIFYRYQEWRDRLHNFNDHIILDISLCITLRCLLQVHTSLSRAVEFLQLLTDLKYPPADTMMQAYLQFEALTDHEYQFSCPSCGDHPPVVVMGMHRHKESQKLENDIEEPPENYNGKVNLETFWEMLSKEMISHGLVADGAHNPFTVPPNFNFWAPWIGKNTRVSDSVLNTEFEKVQDSSSAAEALDPRVSKESLAEELFKQKVDVLRSLCEDCSVDSTGSRFDLLHRLANEMQSGASFEKICAKIWSPYGGWGVIMCPCGIIYSLKYNLRAESPRDFSDLLLSWKHVPNIIVYDFAQGLVAHTNLRAPDKMLFSPFEGCLMDPTQENIERARSGQLKMFLPWLTDKMTSGDPHAHPVTGSSHHYVLCQNTSDVLRSLELVPQLAGRVSAAVTDEFFVKVKENDKFLNSLLPSAHLFLMRNIIHHYNQKKAKEVRRGLMEF